MEDYDTARRELERAVAGARDGGLVSSLPLALSALAELEFRVGNWTTARALAEEALRLAEDADQFLHFAHTVLIVLAAVTGDAEAHTRTPTASPRSPPAAGAGCWSCTPTPAVGCSNSASTTRRPPSPT